MRESGEPLPPAVARALEEYGALLRAHGPTWGEDPVGYVRQIEAGAFLADERDYWAACLHKVVEEHPGATDEEIDALIPGLDLHEVVRDALRGRVLDNLAALRVLADGATLEAVPRTVLDGLPVPTTLLVDSSRDAPAVVRVDGAAHEVPACGAHQPRPRARRRTARRARSGPALVPRLPRPPGGTAPPHRPP